MSKPEPSKYRRKPEVVRAVQWRKPGDHPDVVRGVSMWVLDVGGHMVRVGPGDWIVERADGTREVARNLDFCDAYEPADAAPGPGEATRRVLMALAGRPSNHDEAATVAALVDLADLEAALRECGIEVEP
jgi:hypothetical protein